MKTEGFTFKKILPGNRGQLKCDKGIQDRVRSKSQSIRITLSDLDPQQVVIREQGMSNPISLSEGLLVGLSRGYNSQVCHHRFDVVFTIVILDLHTSVTGTLFFFTRPHMDVLWSWSVTPGLHTERISVCHG